TVSSGSEQWSGAAASEVLTRRLGLDAASFSAAVLLRQDTLRALAASSNAERAAAIDRLLGLDRLRGLLDGLPMALVAREATRLARAAAAREAAGLGSAIQVRRLVAEREAALLSRGVSPVELSASALDAVLRRAADALVPLGVAPPAAGPGTRTERLTALQAALAAATHRRDQELAEGHRQRSRLAEALARLEREAGVKADASSAGALDAEATALRQELSALDARLDRASARAGEVRALAREAHDVATTMT